MNSPTSMRCVACGHLRAWPAEFPVRSYAKCWWCYPVEERVKAEEWQIPPKLRFWRTAIKGGHQ